MTKRARIAITTAAFALYAGSLSCGNKPTSSQPFSPTTTESTDDKVLEQVGEIPMGLGLRITEGKSGFVKGVRVKPAVAKRIDDKLAQSLLARMPTLVDKAGDKKHFALRERSLPPPRTGNTIKEAFPPASDLNAPPVRVKKTPVKVVRFAPEGEVPLAPQLQVTFNQAMIAVTSHADTVAAGVPVKLSPQPKGEWRWIGTRTLLFDPKVRFPAATNYQVEIAAGIKSIDGSVLAKKKTFTFSTPPVTLQSSYPMDYEPQGLEPILFALFDQKIDAKAVVDKITVKASAKQWSVRAATPEEIAEDKQVVALIANADANQHQGRYVAFRVDGKLPEDTHFVVSIGRGTPSAEGPRTTSKNQVFSFHTYGPLKLIEHRCAWGRDCPPRTPWSLRFSNPLDMEKFEEDQLEIEPKLPRMRADASGQWITIRGNSKGRTTYQVTALGSITDKFGQSLGKDETVQFRVGDANPQLFGPSGLVVLDPISKKPTFDVNSINVKSLNVEIYRVQPKDWDKFTIFMRKNPRDPKKPPGVRVLKRVIRPTGSPDEIIETRIALTKAFGKNGLGHAVVLVEPTHWPNRWKPKLHAWVQSTKIGLDAFVDSTELIAWATNLADGKPAANVKLEIVPFGTRGGTNKRGMATLSLSQRKNPKGKRHLLLAKAGDDVAFLPENQYWWGDYGGWTRNERTKSLRWFVFDDRGMYKPNEEVHFKGWIRDYDNREGGDVGALAGQVDEVSWIVQGTRGNEITKGKSKVNAAGGFNAVFKLPKTPNLGWASISFTARGKRSGSHYHRFQIQEFRRPEYEVTTTATEGPHKVGQSADVTVKAAYFAGGGLANADVYWSLQSKPTNFTPPNRSEYTFGTWVPWWQYQYDNAGVRFDSFQGKTDAVGKHSLHLEFLSVKPARPMSLVAEASVTDVNRQRWSASTTMLIHASDLYVGLKRDRYFVNQGDPIKIESIVVDHDGKAVTNRKVEITAVRLDWRNKKGTWTEEETDLQTCVVSSAKVASECKFNTPEGGTYRITAMVADNDGRPSETKLTVWVSGGKTPPAREVTQEKITLIPNKKEFRPGDTAEILVMTPFFPAEGLLTVRRSGITRTERFKLTGPTTTIKVAIKEGHVPNVHVHVDVVGSAGRVDDSGDVNPKLPRRPAYAQGSLNLAVPPINRTLSVEVRPRTRKIEPGGRTIVDIRVKDSRKQWVSGAELAVIVVDESVLALSNYSTPNPLSAFYTQRGPDARDYHQRQYVRLARPDIATLAEASPPDNDQDGIIDVDDESDRKPDSNQPPAPPAASPIAAADKAEEAVFSRVNKPKTKKKSGGKGRGSNAANTTIAVRTDFNALAVFSPEVTTDSRGRASVKIKVPDNLTRYRIMVVAVSGERSFGSGESNITARMPLMVRPSAPRFLNFGDKFEFPVIIQNQTNSPMTVRVAMRATNAAITAGSGRELTVPANDRVEVRFPVAAEMPGTARFQIAASAGKWSDASELSLPVWTPATTEAFATYGEIDKGAVMQQIKMPSGVVKDFGGLEITTSSTQLQALTDALLYLVQYPYECAEQTSSRVLAIAALRDVLTAFEAEGLPEPKEIERIVDRDIKRLKSLQNWDGGFAWWVRGFKSGPYISIHGAHALTRAKDKGYKVPQEMLARSKTYLRKIEQHIPSWYPLRVRRALISYALYVRKRMGDVDRARAKKLINTAGLDKLSMESIGWLLGVLTGDKASRPLTSKIHRFLDNKVTETAAAANWSTNYSDGAHLILHSSRRADSIILESLIKDKPKSDLIPKVVRGLLAHRKRGRWLNTQENVFVLLAMDLYFRKYEKVTPNFIARAWLGNAFAGEQKFKGRSTDRRHIDIPMSYLAKTKGAQNLVLSKKGKGRLYYRIGMTYAPEDLALPPADHGFAVERRYEAVDNKDDVVRQKDGSYLIKAGAMVRVRLTMVAQNRRYHVALVDPLPAGLEAMNPSLAVTGSIPQDPNATSTKSGKHRYWWWARTWYEHQNMRDERVEAFTPLLWAGVHEYTYVARATTPGNFVVPPTKAEEMYFPETFGRSASDRVIVK